MASRKALLIVEGENDEVELFNKLFEKCLKNVNYEIFTYQTTIHTLAQLLYHNYYDFDTNGVDIKLALKSIEIDPIKQSILSQKYTDIYLIFDLDPHHDHVHFDTVKRMLSYFDDPTDNGKLYINYPMMQSFKHLKNMPDDNFKDRVVEAKDVPNYKSISGTESSHNDVRRYNYKFLVSAIVHHLRKANYLLTGLYILPSSEEFLSWDYSIIYDKQLLHYRKDKYLYVLNTSMFIIVDYAPNAFFNKLLRCGNTFDI